MLLGCRTCLSTYATPVYYMFTWPLQPVRWVMESYQLSKGSSRRLPATEALLRVASLAGIDRPIHLEYRPESTELLLLFWSRFVRLITHRCCGPPPALPPVRGRT